MLRRPGSPPRPLRELANGVLVALAVSACGAAASSSTPSPTLTPAPTPYPLNTGAFTVTIPAGWRNLSQDTRGKAGIGLTGTVFMLVQHDPPGAFQANRNDVNTDVYAVPISQGYVTPAEFAAVVTAAAHAATAGSISPPGAISVGGEQGLAVTYANQVQGTPGMHEVVVVNHGLNTYEFFVDSSQYAYGVLGRDVEAILGSLKWVE